MIDVLKYFSSFAAVKICKKRVQALICFLFLPIFTAAKDEKYFKRYDIDLVVIFYQWLKLCLGLDVEAAIQILKVIY